MGRRLARALALTLVGVGLAATTPTTPATAAPGDFSFFAVPASETDGARAAVDITAGPDGDVWFLATSEQGADDVIGRVNPEGSIDTFPLGGSARGHLVTGPDGRLWVASDRLYKVRTDGTVSPKGKPWRGVAAGLVAGPRDHLWLLVGNKVKKLDASGRAVRTYRMPHAGTDLAAGPDGRLWMTWREGVDRLAPAGTVTTFPAPGTNTANPQNFEGITAGPDDKLWVASTYPTDPFTLRNFAQVCKLSVQGRYRCFPGPSGVHVLAAGADGNVHVDGHVVHHISGAVDPPTVRAYAPYGSSSDHTAALLTDITALASGPDGNIWFTQTADEQGNTVGRLELALAPAG